MVMRGTARMACSSVARTSTFAEAAADKSKGKACNTQATSRHDYRLCELSHDSLNLR